MINFASLSYQSKVMNSYFNSVALVFSACLGSGIYRSCDQFGIWAESSLLYLA